MTLREVSGLTKKHQRAVDYSEGSTVEQRFISYMVRESLSLPLHSPSLTSNVPSRCTACRTQSVPHHLAAQLRRLESRSPPRVDLRDGDGDVLGAHAMTIGHLSLSSAISRTRTKALHRFFFFFPLSSLPSFVLPSSSSPSTQSQWGVRTSATSKWTALHAAECALRRCSSRRLAGVWAIVRHPKGVSLPPCAQSLALCKATSWLLCLASDKHAFCHSSTFDIVLLLLTRGSWCCPANRNRIVYEK